MPSTDKRVGRSVPRIGKQPCSKQKVMKPKPPKEYYDREMSRNGL